MTCVKFLFYYDPYYASMIDAMLILFPYKVIIIDTFFCYHKVIISHNGRSYKMSPILKANRH